MMEQTKNKRGRGKRDEEITVGKKKKLLMRIPVCEHIM